MTGVFIFTAVLSCVGFADESTLEGEMLTQGVYSYDAETQTETYEEITFDEESQQAYVSYSSESDAVKSDEGYEVEFDESVLVNEYVESELTDNTNEDTDDPIIEPYRLYGSDNRYEITRPDLSGRYRNTCRLVIMNNNGDTFKGTGFILSDNYIVTAGHCVYNKHDFGGWAKSITVYPAFYNTTAPYGFVKGTAYTCGSGWYDNENIEQDWGIIKINSNFVSKCGYLGLRYQGNSYEDDYVQVTGYPHYVGDGLSKDVYGRHMYTHSEKVSGDTSSLVCYQKLDTSGGQSGAPVIETYSDTGDTVIAIHRGTNNKNVNCGVRLSEWLFDYLVDLRHNG